MAHPDLDDLLTELALPARLFLEDQGDFEPFAAVLDLRGEARLFAGDAGEGRGEPGPRVEALAVLEDGLRELARDEGVRAVGVCWIALVDRGECGIWRRAIATGLEHAEGEAVNVFQTYDRGADGELRFDEPFAGIRERALFRAESRPPRLRLLPPPTARAR